MISSNIELVEKYFNGDLKDKFFIEKRHIYREMSYHFDKEKKPLEWLEIARPNEAVQYKEYRLNNYEAITVPYAQKIIFQLQKIRRAEDWGINYPEGENNELKTYLKYNYPKGYNSFENYFFNFILKNVIRDANGVLVNAPENIISILENGVDNSKELAPFAFYYTTDQIIENNELLTIVDLSEELNIKAYLYIDSEEYLLVKQNDKVIDSYVFKHNLGYKPTYTLGGEIKDQSFRTKLYESFIGGVKPPWREAVNLNSDHTANMRLHIHPEKISLVHEACRVCDGKKYINKDGEKHTCTACNGTGRQAVQSPFAETLVAPIKTGTSAEYQFVPNPAKYYIERPVEQIKTLKEEVLSKVRDGLVSIGFEWIMNWSPNESGFKRELDKEESINFIQKVSDHCVENIIIPIIISTNDLRYGYKSNREKWLPTVNMPRKMNFNTGDVWRQRIKEAKQSNVSRSTIQNMELSLVGAEYGKDSFEYKQTLCSFLVDSLAGLEEEEKATILLNNGCSNIDYIISSNITSFILRAYYEYEDFFSKPVKDKKDILRIYAKEVQDESNTNLPLDGGKIL